MKSGWRAINRSHAGAALDETAIAAAVQMVHQLEEMGVPLLDRIADLPLDADPDSRLAQARQALAELPPGVTHFIIHPAQDTPELRAITPDWACRVADYATFLSAEMARAIHQSGVQVLGYRALQDLMPGR